jgi:hypothetical protein
MSNDAMSEQDLQFSANPVIEVYKKGIDQTLIRENLRLSVEQRFGKLMRLQEFAEELRRAVPKTSKLSRSWKPS